MFKRDKRNVDKLRALRRIHDNQLCFDCQFYNPTYVCTSLNIFVCNDCAGIHRSFEHRVKNILFGNFTDLEMIAIAQGGNLAGKKRWLARWKESEQPRPSHDDLEGLKKFMHMVYVKELWIEKVVNSKVKKHQIGRKPLDNRQVSESSKPSQIIAPHVEDFWRNLHTTCAIEPQVSYYRYLTQSLPPPYYNSCDNLYNPYSIPRTMFSPPPDYSKFPDNPFEALEQMIQNNKLTEENCLARHAKASDDQEPSNNQSNQNNFIQKSLLEEYHGNTFQSEDDNPFFTSEGDFENDNSAV